MRRFRDIVSTVLAVAAILFASGWSSSASACLFESSANVANVVAGGPAAPAPKRMHRQAQQHHQQQLPQSPGGPPMPRLDCAACMAVLPNFPSAGSHELMPFMPEAQTFQPLFGIEPALDPPPPRAAKP